jgi:hypothetical protein
MTNKHAQSLGRLGGQARAKNLTQEQKSAIGKKAVAAREAKKKAK